VLPEKRGLERALQDGAVGPVRLVHDFRNTDYRPGTRPDWFFSPQVAGGGALMNIGAHCLDRTIWFGGATAARVTGHTVSRFGVGVETDATVVLELANGVAATVTVVSTGPGYTDRVTVVGESGVLVADARTGTRLRRGDETTTLYEPHPDDIAAAFELQLADFVATVHGELPRVTLEHSRHVVELVLAAYRSAAVSAPIWLDRTP
jgi:predicted dehydrogenase